MAAAACLPSARAAEGDVWALFSLNVQDFSYPDLSFALVERALGLHESLGVPVDVYLTTTQVDLLRTLAPALLERLRVSKAAAVCYHTRPPKPYHSGYDWLGIAEMTSADQYAVIREYETHGLDLVTGRPTPADGGYAHLTDLLGYHPPSVGIAAEGSSLQAAADTVMRDLGATFAVVHGRAANLGEKRNGLYVRPEHVDLKLFEQAGREAGAVIEEAVAQAPRVAGARAPYVVGIKMHDNDFFATASAWTAVYLNGSGRRPPWDVERRAALLGASEQAAMWRLYEDAVRYVAAAGARLPAVSTRSLEVRVRGLGGR
jgi:hypothetical protein